MPDFLDLDQQNIGPILQNVVTEALQFLSDLDRRPVGVSPPASVEAAVLADEGVGTEATLANFKKRYEPWLSGSVGPCYFGFVTGGTTPAAPGR